MAKKSIPVPKRKKLDSKKIAIALVANIDGVGAAEAERIVNSNMMKRQLEKRLKDFTFVDDNDAVEEIWASALQKRPPDKKKIAKISCQIVTVVGAFLARVGGGIAHG
jgi:ribosomal protein S13